MACAMSTTASLTASLNARVATVQKNNGKALAQAKPVARVAARKVVCSAKASSEAVELSRRDALTTLCAAAVAAKTFDAAPALAGNIPKGFTAYSDAIKGYAFLYPFGWQEVSVDGAEVVYKDVIEPLESVSLTAIPTQTPTLPDLGSPDVVADTLIKNVLTAPGQKYNVIASSSREVEGKTYYNFEFTVENPRYTRHQLATISISNGKFYTLTTGANEKRWSKMQKKLEVVAKSFYNLY